MQIFRCLKILSLRKNIKKPTLYTVFPLFNFATYLFLFLHYYSKYFGLIVCFLGKAIMAKQDCIRSGRLREGRCQGHKNILCLKRLMYLSAMKRRLTAYHNQGNDLFISI